jgi:hypothetical protein
MIVPNLQARTDVVHGLFRITKKHFHLGECPIWALGGEYLFQWWNTQNSHGGTILRSQVTNKPPTRDNAMMIVEGTRIKQPVQTAREDTGMRKILKPSTQPSGNSTWLARKYTFFFRGTIWDNHRTNGRFFQGQKGNHGTRLERMVYICIYR